MCDSHKKLSGAEYRRKAKERQKNECEVLAKVPKLQNYFSAKTDHNTTPINVHVGSDIPKANDIPVSPHIPPIDGNPTILN